MSLAEPLAATLRALPSAALLVSGHGEIIFANAAARDAMALSAEQPGGSLGPLLHGGAETLAQYLKMCSRTTAPIPGAFTVQKVGAQPVKYLCKGALISAATASSPSLILLRFERHDVGNPFMLLSQTVQELTNEVQRRREAETALRRSEAALQQRVAEAENANRLKDEFLALLSHELRTPLNAILGWATMLRDPSADPDRRQRGLAVIERNARAQAQLIDELLDVSRIINGKLRLNVQQLDPIHVVEAAVDSMGPAAAAKEIRLQNVLDPQAGPIAGDPDRLQQIIWNLVSNAVKFTPKGGRVQVLLERINSSIEISVVDTGCGIAPDFLPFVFERFRQQEGSTTRHHGGLGLGLAIAKSLVELHGGTIRAQSDGEGKGASFVVRLPRSLVKAATTPRPFSSAAVTASEPTPCPPEIAGLSIVVVDDEPDALDFLIARLEQCGARVRSASSAAEALALVRALPPDVLISDIGMPGQDGYDLIRQVRALPPEAGGKTLAVALTAFARTEDRTRALTSGFQAHVQKPVEASELFAVIASLADRRK